MENEETVMRFCTSCGHSFATTQKGKKLCPECEVRHRKASVARYKRKKTGRAPTTAESWTDYDQADYYKRKPIRSSRENIVDIDRKAKACGLSYGHYVAKYGDKD